MAVLSVLLNAEQNISRVGMTGQINWHLEARPCLVTNRIAIKSEPCRVTFFIGEKNSHHVRVARNAVGLKPSLHEGRLHIERESCIENAGHNIDLPGRGKGSLR